MEFVWFILFLFLILEIVLVALLCMPMPSNEIRGKVNSWVASLWLLKPVQYTVFALLIVDIGYFATVADALLHPFYDTLAPAHNMGISCEYKQDLFYNERNASITGASIFLFFVLRRLVDIQDKLYVSRSQVKELALGNNAGGGSGGGNKLLEAKRGEVSKDKGA